MTNLGGICKKRKKTKKKTKTKKKKEKEISLQLAFLSLAKENDLIRRSKSVGSCRWAFFLSGKFFPGWWGRPIDQLIWLGAKGRVAVPVELPCSTCFLSLVRPINKL